MVSSRTIINTCLNFSYVYLTKPSGWTAADSMPVQLMLMLQVPNMDVQKLKMQRSYIKQTHKDRNVKSNIQSLVANIWQSHVNLVKLQ